MKTKSKKEILRKLEEMEGYVLELEGMIPSEEEYLSDLVIRRACEKTVQLAVESVIDVISMLVSYSRIGVPNSEDDLVELLLKNKLMSSKLGNIIRGMKGFRNILVHKYGDLEDEMAYGFLSKRLNDFSLFSKSVRKVMNKIE